MSRLDLPNLPDSDADTDHLVVAVTGASGLLGGALARTLLSRGIDVRMLLRRPLAEFEARDGCTVVIGDLENADALDALVVGATHVAHVAAMYRSDGPLAEFLAVNLEGTKRLVTAARTAGVRRFLYCSTIGVHGSVAEAEADENTAFDPRDAYQESKLRAERYCRAQVGTGMEIVILRPCGIYGPGDTRMLKMFRMLDKRAFVQIGPAQAHFHPVYIDDLVDGFLRALIASDVDGDTFILGGPEHVPLRTFVAAAAAALGKPPPWIRVPYKPVQLAAQLCEALCAPLGIEPPLHRRRLTFFKHHRAFSTAHARDRLGYRPSVGIAEGFRRTVEWYRKTGRL
ncbi:NAD-dependent epimerase/dehydratase family protein [Sphingomonas koreensis]|nr:NAD-dependent epimerase/dehydratase family protein [Sphingomonas koreensis]